MQNTDKTLAIALIISFVSHIFMFIPAGNLSIFKRSKEPTTIEVTYAAPLQKNKKKTVVSHKKAGSPKPKALKKVNLAAAKIKVTDSQEGKKSSTSKIKTIKKPRTTANINIKKSNASHTYQQLLKAKVKNYSFFPASMSQGKVNLSFTLSSDGQLKIIKISEDSSSINHTLRLAAIECIKQANPFPPFPDSFKTPEATFNVTISFMSE